MKRKSRPTPLEKAERAQIDATRQNYYRLVAEGMAPAEAAKAVSRAGKSPAAAMVEFVAELNKMPFPPTTTPGDLPATLEDFRALTWPQRKSIAAKLGAGPIKDAAAAEAAYLAAVTK
jgi:hypothetical protein